MRKIVSFIIIYLFSSLVFADGYYQTSTQEAKTACENSTPPNGYASGSRCTVYSNYSFSSVCASPGTGSYYVSRTNVPNTKYVHCDNGELACPSGQSRVFPAGTCTAPPITCTAGLQKDILVPRGSYPVDGTPTVNLVHDSSGGSSAALNPTSVSTGGCKYNIPANPNNSYGCEVITTPTSSDLYCKVRGTQTGEYISGNDTAKEIQPPKTAADCVAPLKFEVDHCAPPSAHLGCYTSPTGDEVCPSSPKLNCGTIGSDKTEVCVTDTGLTMNGGHAYLIDGQPVAEKQNVNGQIQNCALNSSGKAVCVGTDSSPPGINLPSVPAGTCGPGGTGIVCIKPAATTATPNPTPVPINKEVKEATKTATVTNADGSKVVTTTTTNNIVNTTSTVTTTNINSSGQTTSTSTVKGDSQGQGVTDGTAVGASPGAGSGKGRFYTSNGKTVTSVGTAFMNKAVNSPLLKAGSDIFSASIPTVAACAACDLNIPAIMGMPKADIQPFCAVWMETVWQVIAASLKIATVFVALRIMITPTF